MPKKKRFKFEMIGLSTGDKIVFDPLKIEVTISGSNTIEYEGKEWSLSAFVKEYIPRRNAAGTYQGPLFFSYKGRKLTEIREEMDKLKEQAEIMEFLSNYNSV
ncbi:MAG: hypothetical protein IKN48_01990 [Bacteroidaceae bacterium]|nr:hypothetical protein [Bacteroidaceae bacterium]